MGARTFNVSIKLDSTAAYPMEKIAKELFNSNDIELDKTDRKTINISVGIHDDGILLSNFDLNTKVMREHNKTWIDKLYHFFNQPMYIVGYMISDFNNAAGYCIIENGKVIRSRYFDPEEEVIHSHDIGEHLEEEKESIDKLIQSGAYDKEKKMNFTKMYDTGKIEYFHNVDIGLVEIITRKYLGYGAYWGPDNIKYGLIKMDKRIS